MKRHDDLWEKFISPENFSLALANAVRGRKNKPEIALFLKNAAENLESVRQMVARGEFRTAPYRTIEVHDPKKRTIYILPFSPDRLVHHAIMNIAAPIWQAQFVRDSHACIKGRGQHSASRRAMEFCRKNEYVLNCDIRKFYPSISHDKMFEIVRKSIRDEKMLALFHDIIHSIPGGKNIPIGNLCSQWMGNLFLHELDMFAKHKLRAKCYIRYSDDFSLFSNDKAQLREWREEIRGFIAGLGLTFSKCEIFPVSNGLDFVGYRHFRNFVMLRKRTLKRIKKRMGKLNAQRAASERARGQVAAALGWLKHACSYNVRRKLQMERLKKMTGIR